MERGTQEFPEPELRWMRRLAVALVGDAAAEDLVQDAWITLARRDDASAHGRSFLARLLRRLAWRRRRGEARRRSRERVAARGESLPSAGELAEQLDVHEQLVAALKRLREPTRSTLLLRYYGELSAADIARRQGVPAATVRARIQRGLAELRRELDERAGGREAWLGALAPWVARSEVAWLGAALAGGSLVKAFVSIGVVAVALFAYLAWPERDTVEPIGVTSDARDELSGSNDLRREAREDPERVALPREEEDEARTSTLVTPDARGFGPRTRVELRVLDLARRPVAGAEVRAFAGLPTGTWVLDATTESDAEGRAGLDSASRHLRQDVPPMVWLEIVAPGFVPGSVGRRIGADGTTWIGDVLLEPGADVRGLVVDSSGLPVAGARVEVVVPYDALPDGEARAGLSVKGRERTFSGQDGRFELRGIPLGDKVVRARAALRPWTLSPVVGLRQGEALDELVLTLADPEPERWILGRVLGPDGEGVTGGEVLYGASERRIDFFFSQRAYVRAEGRFELGPLDGGRIRVQRPASAGFALAEVRDVEPGTHDLVLQLEPARGLAVRVRDAEGRPLAGATVLALHARPDRELPPHLRHKEGRELAQGETDVGGTCLLEPPGPRFTLLVEAPGFRAERAGPFEGDGLSEEVELTLERAPAIAGRVLADGQPVAGAKVWLRRAEPGGGARMPVRWVGSGVPFLVRSANATWRSFWVSAESDPDGRFVLPIEPVAAAQRGVGWLLHAQADGFASALTGPLSIDPDEGVQDLVVELSAGGVLEGAVRLPAELEPAGSAVWIADEHGECHVQVLGEDSTFRFERLRAGAWQACWLAPEDVQGFNFLSGDLPAPPAGRAPDAHVTEGETTRFVLDVSSARPVSFEGRLVVEGAQTGAWTARICPIQDAYAHALATLADGSIGLFEHEEPRLVWNDLESGLPISSSVRDVSAPLDPDGRFRAALDRPGHAWLTLANDDGRFPALVLSEPLDLTAPQSVWSATLPIAVISGRTAAPDPAARGARTLFHRVRGPGSRLVEVQLELRPDGSFGPTPVAGGAGVLHPARWDERLGLVPDIANELARTNLAADESVELDLR